MVVKLIGIDVNGYVVENLDDAVTVYETEYDDNDNLVNESIYHKEN